LGLSAVDLKPDETTKKVRRSLGFSMTHEKDADNSAYMGEVKVPKLLESFCVTVQFKHFYCDLLSCINN
jgi:hypothetical protein